MNFTPTLIQSSLLLAGLPLLAACKSEEHQPPPDADRILVVASDLEHMPFIGRDEKGAPTGRDVEMIKAIGTALSIPIQWEVVEFREVLPMVEVGAVDVGCATIGITPERGAKVAFTRTYYRTAIAVVVRSAEGEPRSFADLAGKKVGAAQGTTAERAVRRLLRSSLCIVSEKRGTPPRDPLLSGELDAAAMDGPDADALVAASDGALMRMRNDLDQERYALAVRRGRPKLLEEINAVLKSMEASGELGRLNEKYGLH